MIEVSTLLSSGTVELKPVTEADHPGLRRLELGEAMLHHWRFGGYTPSPERYGTILWDGVYSQYIVTSSASGQPLGLVMLYDVDMVHQWAYLGAARFAVGLASGVVFMHGLGLFLDLSFRLAPFRKIYVDTPEYNVDAFRSAIGKVMREEGRLRQHRFFDGRYWDNLILSIDRDEWNEYRATLSLGNEAHPG